MNFNRDSNIDFVRLLMQFSKNIDLILHNEIESNKFEINVTLILLWEKLKLIMSVEALKQIKISYYHEAK